MAILAKGVVSRIDFDLYIPFRIQDGLARLRARSDTGTENFRIHVIYVYYSPVVFVELLDPTDPCTPSTAMVVIREYLWSELRKTHDRSSAERDAILEELARVSQRLKRFTSPFL